MAERMGTRTDVAQAPTRVIYKNAPVSEVSIATQLQVALPFPPLKAIALHSEMKAEYPSVELMMRLGRLGGVTGATAIADEELSPRWWFVTDSGDFLLQLQDDLVATNWRRRADGAEYPCFDVLLERHMRHQETWRRALGAPPVAPVYVCHLMYDNVWPIDSDTPLADVFAFWNTVGIHGRQAGPEVRWATMLEDQQLGETARVDIVAGLGQLAGTDPLQRAARLQMAAWAYPTDLAGVEGAITALHDHIHGLLNRLTTTKARASW